ncbi:hypothetical protein N9N29_01625 [Amylibacter sp.]|nr:hypothetical protein [Amylibacter sp.]
MINLKNDRMNVRFPEICNEYELNISFQRTLRMALSDKLDGQAANP